MQAQIFIDHSLTVELNILFIPLPDLLLVFALNGSWSPDITHQAQPDVKKSAGSGPPQTGLKIRDKMNLIFFSSQYNLTS